ncbi:MAG TPA: choice-of-anchor tandem repeat GloVer-containing protein [Candidatus Acidoferrum sp.]|nr:choice-of-anchor tandem repeat GloVer-containing protein [Candidatus Acidoferrum sp.]
MRPLGPCTLLLVCSVVSPPSAHAQCTRSCGQGGPPDTPVTLYSFAGPPDGAVPLGVLVRDAAGILYGSTSQGGVTGGGCGSNGCGTIFKLSPNGAETVLYKFLGGTDGATPSAGLILDASGNLYGTTSKGGASNLGTIFKLDTAGHETVLYSFTGGPDGSTPLGDLLRDQSGNLYGTTSAGGAGGGTTGGGVAFKLDTNGVQTVLHNFGGMTGTDGIAPIAGMVQDASDNFYGTTSAGGTVSCVAEGNFQHPTGCGTVFSLSSTGTESVLFRFTGGNDGPDGATPGGTLLRHPSGNLYGTTLSGGAGPCYIIASLPPMPPTHVHCGTVFKIDPSGTESLLHKFTGISDGAVPQGRLIQDTAGNLYGTTSNGGNGGCIETGTRPGSVPVDVGCGTIFKIDTSGTESVLAIFKIAAAGGITPQAGLVADSSGNLFGTTSSGGVSNFGTVYTVTSAIPPSPDFTLTPMSPTLTIEANQQGTDMITIAPQNGSFASVIQLSCTVTGPAPTPTCVLNPTSATPGSASVSSTLTITVPPTSAWLLPKIDKNPNWLTRRPGFQWRGFTLAVTILILIVSAMRGRKRRLRYALGFAVLAILAGCGGGSGITTPPHMPSSYTVSVMGNAPNTTQSHTTQVIVTVP